MRWLAAVLIVAVLCSGVSRAQESDRSIQRIGIALAQPPPFRIDPVVAERPERHPQFGIFRFETPRLQGEMIRISIPVGDLVSRAFKGMAAARERRQEAAARREVEAGLRVLLSHTPPPER